MGLIYFEKDGAPPHFSLCVREVLPWFGNRWKVRAPLLGLQEAHIHDSPLDFIIRTSDEPHIYAEKVQVVNHLRQNLNFVVTHHPSHAGQRMGSLVTILMCAVTQNNLLLKKFRSNLPRSAFCTLIISSEIGFLK